MKDKVCVFLSTSANETYFTFKSAETARVKSWMRDLVYFYQTIVLA